MVDTRIRIEEYVLFWRAETYGLYTVFQQQEYDISLELQNVAVQDGDYVGIELNIELCHNSVTIDQLELEYSYKTVRYRVQGIYAIQKPEGHCSDLSAARALHGPRVFELRRSHRTRYRTVR